MMSRFPNPRSQSANTTRPDATARTSCPEGERMNRPFHEGPPRRFDGGDLGVPFPAPRLELFQPGEAGAQLTDELGLRAGNITVVMQLARDAAGLLAREQKFQSALLSVEITQGEQSPEAFPARSYFRLERLAAPQQCIEVALRRRASAPRSAKRAARFRYGALGVPQLVARFRAAFFGLRDFRAQPFDARSDGVELFRLALGERQNGHNEENRSDPDQFRALAWSATAWVRASTSAGSP